MQRHLFEPSKIDVKDDGIPKEDTAGSSDMGVDDAASYKVMVTTQHHRPMLKALLNLLLASIKERTPRKKWWLSVEVASIQRWM
jgi:hypothetical protein